MQATLYTSALYPYDALFSPYNCGTLSLKNRIIAVPPDGMTALRTERFALKAAAGGAGLICTENIGICGKIREHGSRAFHLTKGKKLDTSTDCDGICLDLRDMPLGKAADATKNARRTVGEETPIMCMVSVTETNIAGLACLAWAGADMVCIEPCADNAPWMHKPTEGVPAGCFLELARLAKTVTDIPVAACGKLGYPDTAEGALRDGVCDAVVLGRTLLADPDWCNKAQMGAVDDIIPYINPEGRLLANACATAEDKKRIAVIGGGLSGMSFALCAANRGHTVDIFDSGSKLGSRLLAEAAPDFKADTFSYRRWLIVKLCRSEKIQFFLNSYVGAAELIADGYDAIVYANGTRLAPAPNIAGWGEIPYAPLWVANTDGIKVQSSHVAVLGGGSAGCEYALRLKSEMTNARVTIIEHSSAIMKDAAFNEREWFRRNLEAQGVELMTMAEPVRVSEGCLLLRQNCCAALGTPYSSDTFIRSIPCGFIVLAQEDLPDTSQFRAAQRDFPAAQLYCLPGSFSPCEIVPISRAAYSLAQRI